MKKMGWVVLIAVVTCLASFSMVMAQDGTLTLGMSRDWGYSDFSSEIQGTFTLKASGPANLVLVSFYLDDTKIGEVNHAPFLLQFITDSYPAGGHVLSAVGTTTNGSRLNSNKLNTTFISAADSGKKTFNLIVPILVVVFGVIILSALFPLIGGRKSKNLPAGSQRSYPFGGGICPKCRRPLAFQLFSMNMITGKLVRCPYCGKWSVVGYASLEKLRAAELAELEAGRAQIPQASEEDQLKKELDDSKYQEM